MVITTQRLLTELGNRAWSGFNKDDMVFGTDESQTALAELNAAHRYLLARDDFPFKSQKEKLTTSKGEYEYQMVDGQIAHIYNKNNLEELKETPYASTFRKCFGKPVAFYVNYINPDTNLILYPIPNKAYNLEIIYNTYKFILDKDGNSLDEFQNEDDYLNLPSYLEYIYMDCLILRTMATNNKDENDENYRPIKDEFKEAWANFKKASIPVDYEQRMVI